MADIEAPLTAEQVKALEEKSQANIEKKYDRQIRLWGLHGQTALSKSHIVLLGAGPAGTETMKNLVLPGIGKFSVIDGEIVTQRDLGNNFFVEYSSLGKSRAEETFRLLHELNCFVDKGVTINADPVTLINSNPDFVRDYDVLIANNLSDHAVQKLGEACEKWKKTCLSIRTNGMVGIIHTYAPEHRILETKRDVSRWDFRLSDPWPEWKAFADSFDLEALRPNSGEFTHIPFPVLLIKALDLWKQNPNTPITTDAQKDLFKASLQKMGAEHSIAANFTEAAENAHQAYLKYEIPYETQEAMNDPRTENVSPETPRFWILVAALKAFVAAHNGYLPLVGVLPDISTKASTYVAMQKIFRAKAQADIESFKTHLHELLKKINRPFDDFEDEYINAFCRFAGTLRVMKFSPLQNEFDAAKIKLDDLTTGLMIEDRKAFWYLAFRAAGRFQHDTGRLPGDVLKGDPLHDFEKLKQCWAELHSELGIEGELPEKYLKEMCRFGGSQIHNIAAYIGGVAAQEVIKLITHQWEPLLNTYVFDGITCGSGAIEL